MPGGLETRPMKMRYTVIVEKTPNNYSAYVPDLPGCVSTGETLDELKSNISEAIMLHLDGIVEDGELVPKPSTTFEPSADRFEVEISAHHV
jgi:predicted RNase H-like HicB family nuclease